MDHIAQAVDPFVFRLSIFVLAVFVGYFVGVVGNPRAAYAVDVGDQRDLLGDRGRRAARGRRRHDLERVSGWARGFGFVALIFACVNIFGGFLVTQRMLAMYKKKAK